MMEVLGLKTEQIQGILGDAPETEEDRMLAEVNVQKHMQRVLENLRRLRT